MLFSAVIVLPLLFFVLTLCLDIARFYSSIEEAQQAIDEAVLYSYKFLPYTAEAESALRSHVSELSQLPGKLSTQIQNDSIQVVYEGTLALGFGGYFTSQLDFPFSVSARAQGTFIHAGVLIDSSGALAPSGTSDAWGDEDEWPASSVFSRPGIFPMVSEPVEPRIATQQCYNPVFSPLKRAALRLTDYLSSFERNSLGVGFYPGIISSVDIIKSARNPGILAGEVPLSYFSVQSSDFSRQVLCLAAAEEEGTPHPYGLPMRSVKLPAIPREAVRFTDPELLRFREEQLHALSVRELIWSRAASSNEADTGEAFRALGSFFTEAGKDNQYEQRNALALRPMKVGVLFSGDVPRVGSSRFPSSLVQDVLAARVQQIVQDLSAHSNGSARARIYYLLFQHDYSEVTATEVEELQGFFDQILAGYQGEYSPLSVRVVMSQDPEGLTQGVVRSIVLEGNTGVIDR